MRKSFAQWKLYLPNLACIDQESPLLQIQGNEFSSKATFLAFQKVPSFINIPSVLIHLQVWFVGNASS